MNTVYDWERCTHDGIGQPGCPTCDPDRHRVAARYERLLSGLRDQRDDAEAEALELRAQVAMLREAGLKLADESDRLVGYLYVHNMVPQEWSLAIINLRAAQPKEPSK